MSSENFLLPRFEDKIIIIFFKIFWSDYGWKAFENTRNGSTHVFYLGKHAESTSKQCPGLQGVRLLQRKWISLICWSSRWGVKNKSLLWSIMLREEGKLYTAVVPSPKAKRLLAELEEKSCYSSSFSWKQWWLRIPTVQYGDHESTLFCIVRTFKEAIKNYNTNLNILITFEILKSQRSILGWLYSALIWPLSKYLFVATKHSASLCICWLSVRYLFYKY